MPLFLLFRTNALKDALFHINKVFYVKSIYNLYNYYKYENICYRFIDSTSIHNLFLEYNINSF